MSFRGCVTAMPVLGSLPFKLNELSVDHLILLDNIFHTMASNCLLVSMRFQSCNRRLLFRHSVCLYRFAIAAVP